MTGVDKIHQVRVLKEVKGLPIREVARRVGLSRNTVRRILRSNQTLFTYQRSKTHQPVTKQIRGIIKDWLKEDRDKKKKNRRTAWRMCDLLSTNDKYAYAGSYASVAKCVREIKREIGLEEKEVFIPLIFDVGEAFQFDWGDVQVYIGKDLVTLQLGIVQLCHSRYFYARVYPCQKQELLLDVQRRGFEHFEGVCRRGIYDNLKTAVKRVLKGNHRNLQKRFVRFCSHYLYEAEFCNPARGNEKGRVENMIGTVRRNFFTPTLRVSSIEELNDRLMGFVASYCRSKEHPEIAGKSRYEVYLEEKDKLMHLPRYGFDCCRENFSVTDTCSRVFFDENRYSVPEDYMGRHIMVRGYADEVVASYNGKEVSRHKRLYGRKEQSLNPYHYLRTLERKPRALKNGLPFRNWELPEVFLQYRKLLNDKYPDGDRYFAKTLVLLREWSIKDVVEAIKQAIEFGVLGDSYLLTLLKQQKEGVFDKEYLSITIELSRYSAKQKPAEHYDEMLRNRIQPIEKENIRND